MVIVDDHLGLLVLGDALNETDLGGRPVTTSLWYLRLVAAVTTPPSGVSGPGRLRRLLDGVAEGRVDALRERVLNPPRQVLEVLHLIDFAQDMAFAQREFGLNLIGAETVGAARHLGAPFTVAQPNAGGPIQARSSDAGVDYRVWEG